MFTEIDVKIRNDLLILADTYAKITELSASTISKRFHGQGRFIDNFREGTITITLPKLRDMVDLFSDLWPDAAWPKLQVLSRPTPRGTVYIVRWKGIPNRVKIGYSRVFNGKGRLYSLSLAAKNQNDELEVLAQIPGTTRNEQSIHRFLKDHAISKGLRGWYNLSPMVEEICIKLQHKDFAWGRCRELIEADIAGDKRIWSGYRNNG